MRLGTVPRLVLLPQQSRLPVATWLVTMLAERGEAEMPVGVAESSYTKRLSR